MAMAIRERATNKRGEIIDPDLRGVLSTVELTWNGRETKKMILKLMHQRIGLAAKSLKKSVRHNLRIWVRPKPNPPGTKSSVPVIRSAIGEFPRRETERLRNDIFWEYTDRLTAVVGTRVDYGLVLEQSMGRPFLRRTLINRKGALKKILLKGPPPIKGRLVIK